MSVYAGVDALTSERASTYASRRMDTTVSRSFSVALLLTTIEVLTNALAQQEFLSPWLFWPLVLILTATPVAMAIAFWFFDFKRFWFGAYAVAVLFGLAVWPLLPIDPARLPSDFTPFIWWTIGWGAMAAGLGLNRLIAVLYIVLVPAWFAVDQVMPSGGNASLGVAFQNFAYSFLISAVLTSLIAMLRWYAVQQDLAAEAAATAEAENAADNAVVQERMRLASMLHNQVLTTFNAAIDARSPQQQKVAKELAVAALERLENYEDEVSSSEGSVSVGTFFESLTNLIQKQPGDFTVSANVEGSFELPVEAASALTEATIQAVSNSIMYAGSTVTKRQVTLRAGKNHLKIAIVDDGKGFRPGRVPRNRLGIRTVIYGRVQQVGGKAHISSQPGDGATVVLEWGSHV